MHYAVDFTQSPIPDGGIRNRPVDNLDFGMVPPGWEPAFSAVYLRRKIVQRAHPMPVSEQPLNQVRADKTGSTGNQDFSHQHRIIRAA
jgi:hypothetical protein